MFKRILSRPLTEIIFFTIITFGLCWVVELFTTRDAETKARDKKLKDLANDIKRRREERTQGIR